MSFRRCRAWLVAAMVVVVGGMVFGPMAMAADDPASAEAKKHYEEGTKAFNLGEYPRAIAEFKATYNAKPDPLLLYNIAQSYRLAGDANQALFFYKSFLRNMPGATNRKEVEGQIHKLEKQVADQKKDPASVPPAVVVPPPTTTTTPPANATPPAVTPPPPAVAPPPRSPEPDHRDAPPPFAPVTTAPPPANTEPHVDLTAPAPAPTPADQPEDRPFYKKWWFWVGAAGVVVLLGGIAAANAKKPPNTSLGLYDPTFM